MESPNPTPNADSPAKKVWVAMVRHGAYAQPADVPSAWLPHPLTDAGRAQAAHGAETLKRIALDGGVVIDPVVDASDLLRAWETAGIIAGALGSAARVESFPALRERGLGAGANLTLAEIEAIVERDPRSRGLPPGWKSKSAFRLPLAGAETLLEAGARVASHVERRANTARPGTMKICVGHGAAIRHAAHALGVLSLKDVAALSMHHGVPVVLARAPDGTWSHVAGEWKVRGAAKDEGAPE